MDNSYDMSNQEYKLSGNTGNIFIIGPLIGTIVSTIHVDLVKIKRNDKGEKKIHDESYSPVFILNKQEFSYFDNLISNHFV